MKSVHAHASTLLGTWEALLDLPAEHLADVLGDPRPFARELRHVTPFAGVLTPEERRQVYRDFGTAEQGRRRS